MRVLVLNCTLKKSPEPSNSGMLAEEVISGLRERSVECETVRLANHYTPPDVSSDEGGGDEWPGIREKILASTGLGHSDLRKPHPFGKISSLAQRALERMDAMLSEQNDQGQMIGTASRAS